MDTNKDSAHQSLNEDNFATFSLGPEFLRYHGRWIDSVWKSRPYADAFKENPINLYIF